MMKNSFCKKITKLATISFAAFCFFSCRTTGRLVSPEGSIPSAEEFSSQEWTYLSSGILYKSSGENFTVVKIDLSSPDLQLYFSSCSSEWQNAVNPEKTAEKENLLVSVNSIPFHQKSKFPGSKVKPAGIIIENQTVKSPALERYCGIRFFHDNHDTLKCRIYDRQTEIPSENTDYACGGFWTILEDEEIYSFRDIKDYRTACGTSRNGSELYFLYGRNLSFMDCAEILKNSGAFKAMEFDGGSSSFLYLNGKGIQKPFMNRHPVTVLGFRNNVLNSLTNKEE